MANTYFFSMTECPKEDISDIIGIRGNRAIELTQLNMPILPGLIINSKITSKLSGLSLTKTLTEFANKAEKETGKKFNDPVNPAIFKIVISPSMEIVNYPSIHTIGLTDKTVEGFTKIVGEHFAYHEYARFLIKGILSLLLKYEEKFDSKDNDKITKLSEIINSINLQASIPVEDFEKEVLSKVPVEEDNKLVTTFYQKDSKSNVFLLNFNIPANKSNEICDLLTYLEHKQVTKDEIPKYAKKHLERIINNVAYYIPKNINEYKNIIDLSREFLPKEFFEDAFFQLDFIIKKISSFISLEEMDDDDSAIMIQPMVYGNYGKDSFSGKFYTRNIISGDSKLQGNCFQNRFDGLSSEDSLDINEIDAKIKEQLISISQQIEVYFKEIRQIKFTIEKGKLWIIEQTPVSNKSTQATLKCLLNLLSKKVIPDEHIIRSIKPSEMSDILHPIISMDSVKKMKSISGGIAGAPGAAIGKVYFSTESLLNAHKKAVAEEQDKNFILVLAATFAEDVKGIEVSNGVLSIEGGYAAHASVVARQYGKVSLVLPDIKIELKNKIFTYGDVVVKEGDYITIDVPYYGEPKVIIGRAELIEPSPEESGLLDLIKIINNYTGKFKVFGNGDSPRDAALIRKFGGEGIGLCRTEHMFFDKSRINVFREMILSGSKEERKKSLVKLEEMQIADFYGIFKTMSPYPVTIRLLDAPLHEFLPHTEDELNDFLEYLKIANPKLKKADVESKCESFAEVNPMLGHRGCRVAISYPEIYHMQISSIFKAAYKLQQENIDVKPEIMIPIVMNIQEIKFVKNGKKIEGETIKGIKQIDEDVKIEMKAKKSIEYTVGTMIELPAAALSAREIAQYAEFFSFGTNDLTQTTLGLSRDDFNSFLPDYSKYDIIEVNPFQVLVKPVKELVQIATERGRMTRPDLKIGLCGEQGADPRNLKFLKDIGLNYVSCSSYSIPIAKLAVARIEIGED